MSSLIFCIRVLMSTAHWAVTGIAKTLFAFVTWASACVRLKCESFIIRRKQKNYTVWRRVVSTHMFPQNFWIFWNFKSGIFCFKVFIHGRNRWTQINYVDHLVTFTNIKLFIIYHFTYLFSSESNLTNHNWKLLWFSIKQNVDFH